MSEIKDWVKEAQGHLLKAEELWNDPIPFAYSEIQYHQLRGLTLIGLVIARVVADMDEVEEMYND